MNRLSPSLWGISVCLMFITCTSPSFETYDAGLQYRILSHGQGDCVRTGETLKLQLRQLYRDSLLSDTRDSLPFYQVYDSARLSSASWEIFGKLRKGDSVVFRALSDSAFKLKWPEFARKGEWLITTVKVEDIFGVAEEWR